MTSLPTEAAQQLAQRAAQPAQVGQLAVRAELVDETRYQLGQLGLGVLVRDARILGDLGDGVTAEGVFDLLAADRLATQSVWESNLPATRNPRSIAAGWSARRHHVTIRQTPP
jgi:hypothetical protein